MGARRGFSRAMIVAAAIGLMSPALAQYSDSYSFLQAVKTGDGDKALTYLNKPGAPALNARSPDTGESALHLVIKRHDQVWLRFLLSRGAQPDIKDNQGNTPLIAATQMSDVESIRLLLESGARANTANNSGETPLIIAVQKRDTPSIRLLVSNGADPKITDTIAGKSARDYAQEDRRGGAAILKILDEGKPKPTVGPTR